MFNLIYSMIIDPDILWKLKYSIFEKNIYKISIFKEDRGKTLINFEKITWSLWKKWISKPR